MQKKKIIFIVNPKAGVRKGFSESIIRSVIDQDKFEFSLIKTECEGHAVEIAQKAAKDTIEIVVACGGDGTVNEVVQGLEGSSSTLGIIPLGSGNGLARHLGIPMNIKKALEVINSGKNLQINGGKINGKLFLCAAGFGFDAHVAKLFRRSENRGLISYIRLILKEFKNYPTFNIDNPIDSKKYTHLFLCSIANANQFGNDFKLVPDKKVTDSYLQLVLVEKPSFLQFIQLAYHARFGNPEKLNFVHAFKIPSEVTINAPSFLAHVDGEPIKLDSVEVKIELVKNRVKVKIS